jgi:predicted aconitase
MASWGSTPLFHITGVTPECPNLNSVGAESLRSEKIERSDLDNLKSSFGKSGDPIDVVVFAAPQLSLVEMKDLAELCRGLTFSVPVIVCTSPQVYPDAMRMGFIDLIQAAGGKVLQGTCFYQQYAREIGEANGWKRLLSNSAKIVNILGGYGYTPALASMEICVKSAVKGEII